MNDLNTLLDRAAGPLGASTDVHADLARGHRALARTRRRRAAAGLVGVAAAGVMGVGAVRLVQPDDVPPGRALEASEPDAKPSEPEAGGSLFLPQPFQAGPYTFDASPVGWEVQGFRPGTVTIAPVGFPDQSQDSFEGKLVITLESEGPFGEKVEHNGQPVWIGGDSGYTRLTRLTLPGEPEGNLIVQYPDDTGWDRETMLDFLAGVQVGAGAAPSGSGGGGGDGVSLEDLNDADRARPDRAPGAPSRG